MLGSLNNIQYKLLGMVLAMFALSSCKQSSNSVLPTSMQQDYSAPVRLGPGSNKSEAQLSVTMPVNKVKAKRAIENYRINKRGKPSPYKYVGADLNGDGKAELVVWFTGEDWCAPTGCTLAVLAPTSYGYRSISTIRRVKAPIIVSPKKSGGWHDLYARTGLGEWDKAHKIVLRFGGSGYPGNATLMTPLPRNTKFEGQELFAGMTSEEIKLSRQ